MKNNFFLFFQKGREKGQGSFENFPRNHPLFRAQDSLSWTNRNVLSYLLTRFYFAIALVMVVVTSFFANTLANTIHHLAIGSSGTNYLKVNILSENLKIHQKLNDVLWPKLPNFMSLAYYVYGVWCRKDMNLKGQ